MARKGRGSDLAGLAALGALGYMLSKGSKAAPTGGGSSAVSPAAVAEAPSITDDMRKRALDEGNKVSEGERVSRYKPNPFDVEDAGGGYDRKPAVVTGTRPTAATAPSTATRLKNPGTGNQRGPTAEELAAYETNRNANFNNEGRSRPTAINTGSVRDIPTGGPTGYSGVRGEKIDSSELGRNVANSLAAAGPGRLSGVGMIGYEMRNADAIRKAAMAKEVPVREAVTNPLAWMAGPKNVGKFSGEVPAAGREAVTNPLAWMSGPKNMGKFKEEAPSVMDKAKAAAEKFADRFRKKPMSEADTTGGAGKFGYKRGGKVRGYASGGSVSSASSRADGIATKGKTRGKIC